MTQHSPIRLQQEQTPIIKDCPFCGDQPKWWGFPTKHVNFHLYCSCQAKPEVHGETAQECLDVWNARI